MTVVSTHSNEGFFYTKGNFSKHWGQRFSFTMRSVVPPADTDHCPLATTKSKEHTEEGLHFTRGQPKVWQ